MRAQSHVLIPLGGAIAAVPLHDAATRVTGLARAGDPAAARIAAKVCFGRLGELRRALDEVG